MAANLLATIWNAHLLRHSVNAFEATASESREKHGKAGQSKGKWENGKRRERTKTAVLYTEKKIKMNIY